MVEWWGGPSYTPSVYRKEKKNRRESRWSACPGKCKQFCAEFMDVQIGQGGFTEISAMGKEGRRVLFSNRQAATVFFERREGYPGLQFRKKKSRRKWKQHSNQGSRGWQEEVLEKG